MTCHSECYMGLRPTNGHESHPSLSFRVKPRTVWCRAKRGICCLSSSRNSRFLVATLLGMTEWLDDFRRSVAQRSEAPSRRGLGKSAFGCGLGPRCETRGWQKWCSSRTSSCNICRRRLKDIPKLVYQRSSRCRERQEFHLAAENDPVSRMAPQAILMTPWRPLAES